MIKYNDSARHIHRLPPCPEYEVEAFQTWLGDMAREGYILDRDGFFLGFASFEVSNPQKITYRLQAAENIKAAFDEGEPGEDEIELSEALGWDYVARVGSFHIYRSTDPAAPELNTDPDVQALALKKLSRRLRNTFLSGLFWTLFELFIVLQGRLITLSVVLGLWFALLCLFLIIWNLGKTVLTLRRLRKLRERLHLGEHLTGSADWRSHAIGHRVARILDFLSTVGIVALLILVCFSPMFHSPKQSILDYGQPLPFPTASELVPEAEHSFDTSLNLMNDVERWPTALSRNNICWREMADLRLPDGTRHDCTLIVYYHDTLSPALGKALAWEYLIEYSREKDFKELTLPDLGLDYAVGFYDEIHTPTLILRQGGTVIKVSLMQYGENFISLEDWATLMADSIK